MSDDEQELRGSERHPIHEKASVMVIETGATAVCTVLDISMGGCRLQAPGEFRVRTRRRVEVAFQLCGLPMRFCGVIQWTNFEGALGIQFVDLSPRKIAALEEVVEEIHYLKGRIVPIR
jgi:hypothetical protein